MYQNLRAVYPIVEMYQAFIPTYPSGFWSFAFASKKYHPVKDFDRNRAANRDFYTKYYNEELHQHEIGAVLGVTESRVSQLHARALKALREALSDWIPAGHSNPTKSNPSKSSTTKTSSPKEGNSP